MPVTLTGLVLGFVLGMRHAIEPDHLTAVSTLATEDPSPKRGALLGALWGLGHSVSLLTVGVVLAMLHAQMPPRLADVFELCVGMMLVVLGFRAVLLSRRLMTVGDMHEHTHGGRLHAHSGHHRHIHVGNRAFALRALVVGVVHGLAGSGALTALVLADLPSTASRLGYIVVFGIGSIAGMSLLSGGIARPLARLGRRTTARAVLSVGAGAISVVLGIVWSWPIASRLIGFNSL